MRVLHVMVYDGPGGYNRMIYELCRRSRRSTPSLATFAVGKWTERMRAEGYAVGDVNAVLAEPDLDRATDMLHAIAGDIDLVNVHLGPEYSDAVRGIVSLLELPVVYTLHWAWRLPVRGPIICTSRTLVELQRPSNRCFVIENGVDTTTYRPDRAVARERAIIRVCRPERSAMYFWDAVIPVLDRNPDVQLWIVGETGQDRGPVRYLGYRDDVPELLRRATIFSYAPRPDEGSHDLVVLEAMASGVVPVATRVPATRAITHGRDGFLADYGDVLAFERVLERALRDPAKLRRYARAARTKVQKAFDIDRVAARYEDVYAELLR